jgi:hypothetical protein
VSFRIKLAMSLLLCGPFGCPQTSRGAASDASPRRRAAPHLATTPAQLFVPGGIEQIQQALTARGYLDLAPTTRGHLDVLTSSALRKFQSDQDIARTGTPDHETVGRLGLDPRALFRKSEDAVGVLDQGHQEYVHAGIAAANCRAYGTNTRR